MQKCKGVRLFNHRASCPTSLQTCESCFATKDRLRAHMIRHEEKVPCHICGKLLSAAYITDHMRVHNQSQHHVCHLCNRSEFTRFSWLAGEKVKRSKVLCKASSSISYPDSFWTTQWNNRRLPPVCFGILVKYGRRIIIKCSNLLLLVFFALFITFQPQILTYFVKILFF